MILVQGLDDLYVREVVRYLTEAGVPADPLPADAHVFSEVVERRAAAVIGLVGDNDDEEDALEVVNGLIAAASAPRPPIVVLVTAAEGDAAHVLALKRSGAAYVVVRAAGFDDDVLGHLRGEAVWLSRAALEASREVVTKRGLLETVARAVADGGPLGTELRPAGEGWDSRLGAVGARVRFVPNWLARAAAWLGRRAVYVDDRGQLVRCLGSEQVARALGALARA